MSHETSEIPGLSVLVSASHGTAELEGLLAALQGQSLAPDSFEVVIVGADSVDSVLVDPDAYGFHIAGLSSAAAGAAPSRNDGLALCRGGITLFLDDDAVPARDLLELHMRRHEEFSSPVAIVGARSFTSGSLDSPLAQLLAKCDAFFDTSSLEPAKDLDSHLFQASNLSLDTQSVRQVGGFDERFDSERVADVDLGYRWKKAGFQLVHDPRMQASYSRKVDADQYSMDARKRGRAAWQMFEKHADLEVLGPSWKTSRALLSHARWTFESFLESAEKILASLKRNEVEGFGMSMQTSERDSAIELLMRLDEVSYCRGLLEASSGDDPLEEIEKSPRSPSETSIIVVSRNGIDQASRCLEHLRATREPEFPTEIIFVDNGSEDGSQEFLAAQTDVLLIRNEEDVGVSRARNQGAEVASGDQLVFMSSDALVSPGWLGRMLYHLHASSRSGCIGCLSHGASQRQGVPYDGDGSLASISNFAMELGESRDRQFVHRAMLESPPLLVRREIFSEIRGFDEVFSPSGFQDDDFSLRVHLAGFDNRVAQDVFVWYEDHRSGQEIREAPEVLYLNWDRFRKKWDLPETAAYGDWSSLKGIFHSEPVAELYRRTSQGALPRRTTRAERRRAARESARADDDRGADSETQPVRRTKLTLCMIVKDEEAMLGPCLESVKGVVDDIVVVDTGSSDRSIEIARAYGAEVVHFEWIDDFAAARNAAVARVSEGYVLQLDADERLSSGARAVIRYAVDRGGFDGAQLPLFNARSVDATEEEILVEGKTVESGGVLLPRLMRWAPDLEWTGIVHEHTGRWGARQEKWINLPAPILHMGAVAEYREARNKNERNRTLLRRACAADPSNPMLFCYLGEELAKVDEVDEAVETLRHAWRLLELAHAEGRARPNSIPTASALSALLTKRDGFEEAERILSRSHEWEGGHPNLAFLRARNAWYEASRRGADGEDVQALLEDALVWCHEARSFADVAFSTPTVGGAVDFHADYIEACALTQLGLPSKALEAAERSLAKRPKALETLLVKAEAQILSGEAAQALSDLGRLLIPDVPDVWILSAWAGFQFGGIEEVRSMVEQGSRSARENELLVPYRAWILRDLEAELETAD